VSRTATPDRSAVKRAAGLVATAVGLAVVCTFLGLWQWHRHESRSAAIAVVEANYAADPVPIGDVLASPADTLRQDEVWRPVRVTGRYDRDAGVLLRNRPVNSQPSFHVLVPFVVEGPGGPAAVLVVDRGWMPTDADLDVEPPAGEVELVVRLRADEPASGRDAPAGQVQAISVDQVLAAGGADGDLPGYAAYGALVTEEPAARTPLGPLPEPSTDPGSHLSYALQWWTFALGALVGFSVMARRELLAPPDGEDDSARVPRRRRTPSAEDVEDALIDAQLR